MTVLQILQIFKKTREYYEQPRASKFDNKDEMDKLPQRHIPPKHIPEEINSPGWCGSAH